MRTKDIYAHSGVTFATRRTGSLIQRLGNFLMWNDTLFALIRIWRSNSIIWESFSYFYSKEKFLFPVARSSMVREIWFKGEIFFWTIWHAHTTTNYVYIINMYIDIFFFFCKCFCYSLVLFYIYFDHPTEEPNLKTRGLLATFFHYLGIPFQYLRELALRIPYYPAEWCHHSRIKSIKN